MQDIKKFVEENISKIDTPQKIYQFFNNLGYQTLEPSYSGLEAFDLSSKDKEFVKKIYTIVNYQKRFQIFLVELKRHSSEVVRTLPLYFEREIQYPLLIFTENYKNYTFVLIDKIRVATGTWKRKLIRLNFDRENAYYTDKLVISNMAIEKELADPIKIYQTVKEAMSVEKVSRLFFEDYKTIFFKIRNLILKQHNDMKIAHEFSQQLLNRIMFIYFIDKKRWLKNSPKFMKWFWTRYLEEKNKNNLFKDEFYDKWLKVLFFEAFNNKFSHPQYLPQDIKDALKLAPFLNGGLFKKTKLDSLEITLPDEFVEKIINFFEKYNFTIREDLPLDVEVAVDPAMIGYVYESLANVAEEIYERQDLGIFYTPKIEVDFMCRRSLVEYLHKNLPDIPKEFIYYFVFNENNQKVEKFFTKNNLWIKIEEALDKLAVLDPACGSGAFLVGMLDVLTELYKVLFKHLNRQMTDYELKKRIIAQTLYGVDVMPWAVHSAELRLWLSLMIESDLTISELKIQPLLPNFNLNLRVGDSLVQEIGNIFLNLKEMSSYLPQYIVNKLKDLKREKEKFYNNDPTGKFKTEEAILQEELRIFYEIIDTRIIKLEKEKAELNNILQTKAQEHPELLSQIEKYVDIKEEQRKFTLETNKIQELLNQIDKEIQILNETKQKLKQQKPFIWEIDFAEIFGEKGGFDIVIGNPPYVRQEKIAPPNKLRKEISENDKKEYKEKLLKAVRTQFPFITQISKRSDLYVYFYLISLSLLNEKGTFCFITSNSWLDVAYGKDLQEFLLKYVPMIAIYDNQVKRSFEHADINTIIALFNAPTIKTKKKTPQLNLQENILKFVMFKKPFEE
ncbi:MAG: Eco57I restriction-modification methylase domain-containing protein, partial [Candidatus Aenigmarchaeota archaeon]|nr:Eco57I restriction-modification methylase domain-containing protein [Candidatus Aenigmarchaeota archaeon]MDW8149487.1 Eco57I restriction-modification methylase domain-containing protein [Candidatus Aenigmarchaeota archaeon]